MLLSANQKRFFTFQPVSSETKKKSRLVLKSCIHFLLSFNPFLAKDHSKKNVEKSNMHVGQVRAIGFTSFETNLLLAQKTTEMFALVSKNKEGVEAAGGN